VQRSSPFLNIKVTDQDNSEVHFKIRMNTKLVKVFAAFCTRKALDEDSVRFLFKGQRMAPYHTGESWDMEDGDEIQAMMEQMGD
jgi:small ubiquitin-related modifier